MRLGRRTQVVKGAVCKTAMQRFDSARRLHTNLRLSRRLFGRSPLHYRRRINASSVSIRFPSYLQREISEKAALPCRPSGSLPLGATPPDCAGRKPSEIPSGTRSVSAFLPGTVSVGPRSSSKVADGRQGSAKSSNDRMGFVSRRYTA